LHKHYESFDFAQDEEKKCVASRFDATQKSHLTLSGARSA
jgi:hypothetical protein